MVFSYVCSLPVSRILFLCRHVSGTLVASSLERHSRNRAGTVLHTRMYLAVSAGLNRIVSVRNTVVTHDGNYPLRSLIKSRVFGLSSPVAWRVYPAKNIIIIP